MNTKTITFLLVIISLFLIGCSSKQDSNGTTIKIDSIDKSTDIVYSHLNLQIPSGALKSDTEIQIVSLAATEYDRFIGGGYMISPKNIALEKPVTVSITLTDNAISTYMNDISQSELTLAYFDSDTYKYIPITSIYDKNTKTVTGEITTLYGDGIMIIEKSQ